VNAFAGSRARRARASASRTLLYESLLLSSLRMYRDLAT
jgi:hypothetical protein